MSEKHPPLTCTRVKQILTTLGFTPRIRKENSYEQWVRTEPGYRFKVALDCPKSVFTREMIASIVNQAGVSEKEFYSALRPYKPAPLPETEPK